MKIARNSPNVLALLPPFSREFGILLVILQTTVVGVAWASNEVVEIHVSPHGRDSSPGTAEQPVASLERAIELVRNVRNKKGPNIDINVVLDDGVYRLEHPLIITPAENPGPGHLRFIAANVGKAVVSGGRLLTGWKQVAQHWEVAIPSVNNQPLLTRELFINGRRAVRARTPNSGFFRIDRPGPDKRTSLFIRPEDAWAFEGNIAGCEFVYLHDWSTSRVKILSFDPQTLQVVFSQRVGCSAPHYEIGHWPHARYFLENGERMLDQPGEWRLDTERGVIAYLPQPGENLESIEAVVPILEALAQIRGDSSSGVPVRHVQWQGIVFEHCRFDLPDAGYAAGQATVYEPRRGPQSTGREMMPAAVTLDLADGCAFVDCSFRHLGGSGLWFRRECRNGVVRRCFFHDISGNGINIGETLTRPLKDVSPEWTSPFNNGCTYGIHVEDSVIRECGVQFFEAVGIWIGISPGNVIEHNEVAQLPYTGISVGWSWNDQPTGCRDNIIRANHIHHCMLILHDGGGIYTLGRQPGTRIVNNLIHDIPPNEDGAESNGIFMDEGSSDILVEGQTIYNIGRSPIRFHKALEITLRRNTLVCQPGVPPYRYNRTDPKTLRFEDDRVIEAGQWEPPAEVESAVGPRKMGNSGSPSR